jgi:nucleotide-binding universal stress UspA family protein
MLQGRARGRSRQGAAEAGVEAENTGILGGHSAHVIINYVEQAGFDCVVLGHRSRGLGHRFRLGSTHKVAAYAICLVLVVA